MADQMMQQLRERLHVNYGADLRAEVAACRGFWLFTDGGMIGPNPSAIGGTWAWRLIENNIPLRESSGLLMPAAVDPNVPNQKVTNNMSELAAMVYAMEALPQLNFGVRGHLATHLNIVSDSKTTLRRLFDTVAWEGTPAEWRRRAFAAKTAITHVTLRAILVDGHPTEEHLARGYGKRGRAVSKHNRWCDLACSERATHYQKEQLRQRPNPVPKEVFDGIL